MANIYPEWAKMNPIRLDVSRDSHGELQVRFFPNLEEERKTAAELLEGSG